MKIEYVRNMQFGYMKIALEEPLSKTEEEMLTRNSIEGILPVRWQRENDKYLLRYDITGKQALDGVLDNAMADEKILRCLLVGIGIAVKQLEKYLLPQDGLVLKPETIFWDSKTERMYFCYCPEGTRILQEELIRLLEYVLAKTNHKNIAAVQLAYGVYEEVQKPSFCMNELQIYIQKQSCWANADVYEAIEQEVEVKEDNRGAKKQEKEEKAKRRWWDTFVAWIKDRKRKSRRQKGVEEMVVYEREEEPVRESATTVLSISEKETERLLRYEGTNSLPDIPITKSPFVIGTAANCDGVVKHPHISRYHAKITYRDEGYFIEDLNSTNGTRVNGGLLSYKTKVSLKKNESIYFANEPYRFL